MSNPTAGTDVVDLLTADHREVLDLIDVIETQQDPDHKRATADTVIAELVRHSVAEEMFVYPAIKRHFDDGDEVVEHDVQEHQELEETMKQLERADAGEPGFTTLVEALRGGLEHHARDEEQEQFPRLREHITSRPTSS